MGTFKLLPFQGGGREGDGVLMVDTFHYDYPLLDRLRAVLASYRGHFKWADSRRLQRSLPERFPFLREYFRFDEDGSPQARFVFRRDWRTLRGQRRYFSGQFPDAVTLLQVGSRYETTSGTRIGKGVLKHYVRIALASGRSVVLVRETGQRLEKIQERLPFIKLTPCIDNSRKEKLPC